MLHKILNRDLHRTTASALNEVRDSISHAKKISDLTHNMYKYPACFPPSFPRAVIASFSKENDWILDPFVGGGTTAVEAMASGRNFVGTDINELAVFSAKLKTLLIEPRDVRILDAWLRDLRLSKCSADYRLADEIFFKNVPPDVEVAARKLSSAIKSLPSEKLRHFAKGASLRLFQLELEHRREIKNLSAMELSYKTVFNLQLEQAIGMQSLVDRGAESFLPDVEILAGDAGDPGVASLWTKTNKEFNLVVTSPPYPERHILYNKWQVRGRTETRLPYWIIGSRQVEHEPFYTMSSRDTSFSLEIYISNMQLAFENLNDAMAKNGVLVQVVAFSDVARQLPLFLGALNATGFNEIRNVAPSSHDGRLWRDVPHRKWFNRVSSQKGGCKEVVLFHRKTRST